MSEEMFLELITSGDEVAVRDALEDDPSLASTRFETGVSALMTALYHRQQATAAIIADVLDEVDLLEATALGRIGDVRAMLSDGVSTETRSPDGFAALHYAAFFAHADIVRLLIEHGADVSAVAGNPMKVQPLHSAASARSVDAVRALLEAGAAVDARQEMGYTAFLAAAHTGEVEMGRLLLDHGADPNLATDDGKRARDLADAGGHRGFLELLPT